MSQHSYTRASVEIVMAATTEHLKQREARIEREREEMIARLVGTRIGFFRRGLHTRETAIKALKEDDISLFGSAWVYPTVRGSTRETRSKELQALCACSHDGTVLLSCEDAAFLADFLPVVGEKVELI